MGATSADVALCSNESYLKFLVMLVGCRQVGKRPCPAENVIQQCVPTHQQSSFLVLRLATPQPGPSPTSGPHRLVDWTGADSDVENMQGPSSQTSPSARDSAQATLSTPLRAVGPLLASDHDIASHKSPVAGDNMSSTMYFPLCSLNECLPGLWG